jgi:hypothetical protein
MKNLRKSDRLRIENPMGDYDKDGVPNYRDCSPTNKKKHGIPLVISPYGYDITDPIWRYYQKLKKKRRARIQVRDTFKQQCKVK